MRKILLVCLVIVVAASILTGCNEEKADRVDRDIVEGQQQHYQKVHPVPHFDYSIPRDVYIQIYSIITTKAYTTYTIIESITGETKFHGPSIGYGIPEDTQLTNPLTPYWKHGGSSGVVEQAEPSGVFSSKNTDGTWVMFIQNDGSVVPIYTEHKVTTFPFEVEPDGQGGWIRTDNEPVDFTIDVKAAE